MLKNVFLVIVAQFMLQNTRNAFAGNNSVYSIAAELRILTSLHKADYPYILITAVMADLFNI